MTSNHSLSIDYLLCSQHSSNCNSTSDDEIGKGSALPLKSRFSFNAELDVALVQLCLLEKPWLSKRGRTQESWLKIYREFVRTRAFIARTQGSENAKLPTEKTLSDRFRLLCVNRKAAVRRDTAASGIAEEVTELGLLLD